MSTPTITNSFANGTDILATDHNQNYDDTIRHLTNSAYDFAISDITTNGDFTVSGASIFGASSSDAFSVNALVNASIVAASGKTLGTSSIFYKSVTLTNGIYFDAGTTYKISASGTELDIVPGTDHDLNGIKIKNTTLSTTTATATNLTVGNNILGDRHVLTFKRFGGSLSTGIVTEVSSGSNIATSAYGIYMPANGSIVGDSSQCYVAVSGSTNTRIYIYKNGAHVITIDDFTTGTSGYHTAKNTHSRGTYTFSSGDYLSAVLVKISGTITLYSINVAMEVVFDA